MDTDGTEAYMDHVRAVLRAPGHGMAGDPFDEAELIRFAEQRGWSVQVHLIGSTWTATIRGGGPYAEPPLAVAKDHGSQGEAVADAVAMVLQAEPLPPSSHLP